MSTEASADEITAKAEHEGSCVVSEPTEDGRSSGGDDDREFPTDEDIADMAKDVDLSRPLATITERYFAAYYRMNFPKDGEDVCIRIHTNRLCMISLAPSHPILRNPDLKVVAVDFQVTEKLNRARNAVSGKAKHGAQPLHESSKICTIRCAEGETWTVRCGMNGKLTEANTDLLENPNLLREPPHKGGYLAIVLPKINALDKLKSRLVTQDVYDAAIRERSRLENGDEAWRANGNAKRTHQNDIEIVGCPEKIMKTDDPLTDDGTITDGKVTSGSLGT